MQVTFEDDLHRRLKHLAIDTGMTLANVVRTAVEVYLCQEEMKTSSRASVGAASGTLVPFLDIAGTSTSVPETSVTIPSRAMPAEATEPTVQDPVQAEAVAEAEVPDPNQVCRHKGYGA